MLVNRVISKINHQQLGETSIVKYLISNNFMEYSLLQLLKSKTYAGIYSKIKCQKTTVLLWVTKEMLPTNQIHAIINLQI